jgi:hypothetical protein
MRSWRWRRQRTVPLDPTSGREATAARKKAESRWQRVEEIRAAHERLLRENHFAERVRHALEGQ